MVQPATSGRRDYLAWHRAYDDPASGLSRRLAVVQDHIRTALDASAGPFRAVSACSGDGRDLLDVLAGRGDAGRVQATLLELHPDIADLARQRAVAAGLTGVDVRTVDAGTSEAYLGSVPADLVLLVGIFGNIADADIATTLGALPQLCAPGAVVVWSRGRDDRDLGGLVRRWCVEAGCDDLGYTAWPDTTAAVGAARFVGRPEPLDPGQRLFTFLR